MKISKNLKISIFAIRYFFILASQSRSPQANSPEILRGGERKHYTGYCGKLTQDLYKPTGCCCQSLEKTTEVAYCPAGQFLVYKNISENNSDNTFENISENIAEDVSENNSKNTFEIANLKPFCFVNHGDWLIARTGYTGEDGFEIIYQNQKNLEE